MRSFGDFTGFLSGSVGNGLNNDPDDVRTVKRHLSRVDFLNDDDTGNPILTRDVDIGIRGFQKGHDLKVDGILKPGGETERGLFETITNKKADDVFGKMDGDGQIGFGGNVSGRLIGQKLVRPKSKPQNEITSNIAPTPKRKPEVIAPTAKGNELLDFIGKLESSDNYNIIYGGEEKPLTKMTVKEVFELQKRLKSEGADSTAVGRYQIINSKMKDLTRWMNLDENSIFDKKLQDQMGRELLSRRGFEKFKAGKMRTKDFIGELSKEWAAFPKDESNRSYHGAIGNNKALTDFETIKNLLEKE